MPLLANIVLIAHLLFVLFVVGGLIAIGAGAWLHWHWVRNFRFRILHLAAIVFVAAESIIGVICPLTILEDLLRGGKVTEAGFIQRWVSRILYYDFPEWVFTIVYAAFALVVAAAFRIVRPELPRRLHGNAD